MGAAGRSLGLGARRFAGHRGWRKTWGLEREWASFHLRAWPVFRYGRATNSKALKQPITLNPPGTSRLGDCTTQPAQPHHMSHHRPGPPLRCVMQFFQASPKNNKKSGLLLVKKMFLLSSTCAKMIHKSSTRSFKTSQVAPKMAILTPSCQILKASYCQLGPNFACLAPIFAQMLAAISTTWRPTP